MFKSPFYFYNCNGSLVGNKSVMRSAHPQQSAQSQTVSAPQQQDIVGKPQGGAAQQEESYIVSKLQPRDRAVATQQTVELNPQPLPPDAINPALLDFYQNNPQSGFLRLRVSTAQQAIPIYNAVVKIYLDLDGTKYEIASEQTDASGLTVPIALHTPEKRLSLDPKNVRPYADYDIVVTHPEFRDASIFGIPIFDGITTTQNVEMQPANIGLQQPTQKRIQEDSTWTMLPERRSHRNTSV